MARRHGGTVASSSVVIAVGLDAAGPDSDEGFPGAVWVKRLR